MFLDEKIFPVKKKGHRPRGELNDGVEKPNGGEAGEMQTAEAEMIEALCLHEASRPTNIPERRC